MARTYWKRIVPHNMNHALRLCQQHAAKERNMSTERIADKLRTTADTLYKWIANVRMPVDAIIAYEQACDINFVTQYLAHSQGMLLVPNPTGRKAANKELVDLQLFMTEVSALLIRCHQGDSNSQETIDAIKVLMQDLAFHQKKVEKQEQPQTELCLGADHD